MGQVHSSAHAVVCQGEIWGELDQFVLLREISLSEAIVEEQCNHYQVGKTVGIRDF